MICSINVLKLDTYGFGAYKLNTFLIYVHIVDKKWTRKFLN